MERTLRASRADLTQHKLRRSEGFILKARPKVSIKLAALIGGIFVIASASAQEPHLQQSLGTAFGVLTHATHTATGPLKIVSASEADRYALKKANRIVGYPIAGKLGDLNQSSSQELATIPLNKDNYADVRQRCRNKSLRGIRFSKGGDSVEVAMGVPCNQVLVAFREGKEGKRWGWVLGDAAMSRVLEILGQ